ncbi:hypothetical protein Gasu2_69390 [Galdieria sulphuraria]|nr:hypothetical protein Gasu2_69390 [Galdieria sulphuraria]
MISFFSSWPQWDVHDFSYSSTVWKFASSWGTAFHSATLTFARSCLFLYREFGGSSEARESFQFHSHYMGSKLCWFRAGYFLCLLVFISLQYCQSLRPERVAFLQVQ